MLPSFASVRIGFMDEKPAQSKQLVNIQGLSDSTGLPVRTIRTLVANRRLPVVRLGHRTVFFRLPACLEALQKFEVKAVTQ